MSFDTPMLKKVYIETFGCQMNESDTDRLLSFLAPDFEQTLNPELADVIVLNTCTVRDKAEQKVYSAAGKFKGFKDKKKDLVFAICGCVAQQEGERLLKRIAHLDLVFGPDSVHRITEMLEEVYRKKRVSLTTQTGLITAGEYRADASAQRGIKALVNIMRGCNNFCSYCIVPFTRGREVSRSPGDIIEEITALADAGVREVTLLGQNVNSYAYDDGSKDGGQACVKLLSMVCAV
ncbi:MAG: radical SAM protein, partial [Proteobacteria bacterium]|nr:radical SAM protein [Pseudomonadota bacterium]